MILEQKHTTINVWGGHDRRYICVIDIGHASQRILQQFSVQGDDVKLLNTELVSKKKIEDKIIEYKGNLTQWTPVPLGDENAGA